MNQRILPAIAYAIAGAALACASLAHAAYPDKPIRLVVPYPPGGVGDTVSREVGQQLAQRLGTQVVIENRPGGKLVIATENVARAAPDGYTLLLASVSSFALNPAGMKSLPYDPRKDFAPVSRLFDAPLILVASPSLGVDNVKQLIAYARSHPDKLNYGSIGAGSSTHLAAELMKADARIDLTHIPYKGSAPAIADLLGGRIQMMFDGGPSSLPHVQSGRLKLLAVTSAKRFSYLPEVPTVAESGLPNYDVTPWWGIVAPAGTPQPIVDRLAAEIADITRNRVLRDKLGKQGVELVASTPAEFGALIETEIARWTRFFKQTGISLDDE
ncbi:Tripartite tricarboxylate transporter family receptor [Pigmentiphaga humi]|uniref:Tripartite tricarboxylate transporter family receptor n=1 Tax=Pigmentiphaga humi TaxID=2478468 RepID=A0A3P4B635_9BURK|nr:tripartite tricarboxylate transporter substrate binding protein [Pigmentiphaga humi]VCU71759.1 Tripartite tricarboxylate transporter family receptor [Pigmentiphaga humi]